MRLGPYLILQNLLIFDKGEHLYSETLVVKRNCNSGIAHNWEEGGGIAVIFVLTARKVVRVTLVKKKKVLIENLADIFTHQ